MCNVYRATFLFQFAQNPFVLYDKDIRKGHGIMGGESMKIQESGENYLETILMLKKRIGQVRSIDIVREMDFSKPTVSVAMKRFRENGYITVDGDGFITLTEKGQEIAERIYERHEVIAEILMRLGVPEETAYEDSCRIEHDLSDETFSRIKEHYYQHVKKETK